MTLAKGDRCNRALIMVITRRRCTVTIVPSVMDDSSGGLPSFAEGQ